MSKNFGKFVLVTAALTTAAATLYYLSQKSEADKAAENGDLADTDGKFMAGFKPRKYVSLTPEDAPFEESDDDFTPLKDTIKPEAETPAETEEDSEEFFDEDDPEELE